MVRARVAGTGKCWSCWEQNTERVKFRIFKFIPYKVCQSCVSAGFRSFTKNK